MNRKVKAAAFIGAGASVLLGLMFAAWLHELAISGLATSDNSIGVRGAPANIIEDAKVETRGHVPLLELPWKRMVSEQVARGRNTVGPKIQATVDNDAIAFGKVPAKKKLAPIPSAKGLAASPFVPSIANVEKISRPLFGGSALQRATLASRQDAPVTQGIGLIPPPRDGRERDDKILLAYYMKQICKDHSPTLADWQKLVVSKPPGIEAFTNLPFGEGHFVMSLCEDGSHRLWVGTEGEGLWCYDPNVALDKQWRLFTVQDGLGDNYIYALASDRLGRVWAGHLNHGVTVYNGETWQNYNVIQGLPREGFTDSDPRASFAGPLGPRVFAVATSPVDGDVWISTDAGLSRYSLAANTWSYFTRAQGLPSDQSNSLAFAKDGTLYLGTQCDGIAIAHPTDNYQYWQSIHTPAEYKDHPPPTPAGDGLPTDLINQLLIASDGTIYAATTTGLASSRDAGQTWQFRRGADWKAKRDDFLKTNESLSSVSAAPILAEDYSTALAKVGEGYLFVGHREKGVDLVEDPVGTLTELPVSHDYVTIVVLSGSNAIVGTYGRGLLPLINVTAVENMYWHKAESTSSIKLRELAPVNSALQTTGAPIEKQPKLDGSRTITASVLPFPMEAKPLDLEQLKIYLGQVANTPPALQPDHPKVIVLDDDWRTQGAWLGRYGRYWAWLSGMDKGYDYFWGASPLRISHIATVGNHCKLGEMLRWWQPVEFSAELGALEMPPLFLHRNVVCGATTWDLDRQPSEWDDHGERYHRTFDGPDINISITIPSGPSILSVYEYNMDAFTGTNNKFRDYCMTVNAGVVANGKEEVATKPQSATSRICNFHEGVYKKFLVTGPAIEHVTIKRNYSFNTICSGVMLDRLDEQAVGYDMSFDESEIADARINSQRDEWEKEWVAHKNIESLNLSAQSGQTECINAICSVLSMLPYWNEKWWAENGHRFSVTVARWCKAQSNIPGGNVSPKVLALCYFYAGLHSEWEKARVLNGQVSCRTLEKSLRWDGITANESSHGYEFIRNHRQAEIVRSN
jgi:hypothetical protein